MRVGKVSYLNAMPLFYSLRGFEIVEGHPSYLVKLLRSGEIDAGIVSSVEYFFNPQDYYVLPDISISSRGKVCSVLLLSEKPIHEIKKVRITPNSLTSRYLLFYLLKEVYRTTFEEVNEGEDALLIIGDEAMEIGERYPFSYDLGEEWFRATGLPFVFALFLVRKESLSAEVMKLHRGLKRSLSLFFKDLREGKIKKEYPIREYFETCIDYGFGSEYTRSLGRFFSFMEKETGRSAPHSISLFHP